ncbi:MAG: hypothetical protein JRI32_10795 [Deltaproteobacteria bacterium]|nr:hypothetical protein [Deltaproteobacteria bacterium]
MSCLKKAPFVFLFIVIVFLHLEETRGDGLNITPFVALEQEYNDNIFFDDDDETNDFIATISPGLELIERTERLDTRLSAQINNLIYYDNDELNSVDQYYTGRLRYRITPKTDVSAEAGYTRDSRSDRDIEETGLVLSTATRHQQRYSLSGRYMLSEKTAATLSYAYDQDDFDDSEFDDSRSHSTNLGFTHNISYLIPQTLGRMNLGYARYDFPDSVVDNYTWTIGASRDFTEILTFLVDFGIRYTRSEIEVQRIETLNSGSTDFFAPWPPKDEEKSTGWGGVGEVALSYRGELTDGSLSFFRDVRAASGRTGATERTALVFEIGRRITEKLRGNLSTGYYLNNSEGDDFAAEDIDEKTLRFQTRARYEFTKDIALEASYTFTTIRDSEENTTKNRNLVFMRAVFQYPILE